ncbi:MAG TPA: ribosomal protein S18-alanine N-acetyltransferase [Terriglobia bacterium]|nr:ribosomal protein S18-alanine N-acetyltransferase [Terriglobia bacterium]
MATIEVRPMAPGDVAEVVKIQHAATEIAQWRAADYEWLAAEPSGMVLVAEWGESGGVAGFAAARNLDGEAEIRNLAVRAECRRRGVARRLVEEVHRRLAATGVERVFLEVRPSNLAARGLYRSFGYTECGVRRHYYQNDGEDALVLDLALVPRSTAASPPPDPANTV